MAKLTDAYATWKGAAPYNGATLRYFAIEDKSSGTGLIQQLKVRHAIPVKPLQRSGFASGKEDLAAYYDGINGLQESRLRPALDKFDAVLARQVFGDELPDDWWYEFHSLNVMTDGERVTAFETFARGANTLIAAGVIHENQAASELKQSWLFDNVSDDDIKQLKEISGPLPGTGGDPYALVPSPPPAAHGRAPAPAPTAAAGNPVQTH
ncbi:Phage protein [plant metagenome]|uniref:Phage protein n=1 Tax=plant metagenome TaxID=1297885 RepID=A0A484R0N1_9ZZZZ